MGFAPPRYKESACRTLPYENSSPLAKIGNYRLRTPHSARVVGGNFVLSCEYRNGIVRYTRDAESATHTSSYAASKRQARCEREAWCPIRCEVAQRNGASSPFPAAFATARDRDLFATRLPKTLHLPGDWLRQLQLVRGWGDPREALAAGLVGRTGQG